MENIYGKSVIVESVKNIKNNTLKYLINLNLFILCKFITKSLLLNEHRSLNFLRRGPVCIYID